MSAKAWIIFVIVCVVGFGGLVVLSQKNKVDVADVHVNTILPATKASGTIADHVYGNRNAKVVLIEYGDFQCPGCGAAHPRVKSLMEKYKKNVAFVFRNFPLTQLHPNARAAAAAVEAAGLEGKYWQMHNLMYESQGEWSEAKSADRTDLFAQYAVEVGLKAADFKSTLTKKNTDINRKISFDQALGRKVNVSGTPTFYLDGAELGEETFSTDKAFDKAIADELKKKGVEVQ